MHKMRPLFTPVWTLCISLYNSILNLIIP